VAASAHAMLRPIFWPFSAASDKYDKEEGYPAFPEERMRVIRGHSLVVLFLNFSILRCTVFYSVILVIREYRNLCRLRLVYLWILAIFGSNLRCR